MGKRERHGIISQGPLEGVLPTRGSQPWNTWGRYQAEGSAGADHLGGNVLGMLVEQPGDHCGRSGVGRWGRDGGATVGDRSRS